MSFSRFVAWTGTSGAWSDPANWYQEAPTQFPNAPPPTATDVADVFLFQDAWSVIDGGTAAAAGQLYLNGYLVMFGQFGIGDAYVGQASGNVALEVVAGSTLTAHDLSDDASTGTGEVIANGAGARITVATTLDLESEGGGLAALNGGTIQAAAIIANRPQQILVDATGAIEFGGAGDATAGQLTVDAGVTASDLGYVQAAVTVNGTINAVSDWTTFADAVGGSGVIAGFARFLGPVAAGPTLALELTPVSATLEAGVTFGALITGLDQGDILQIDGAAFTTASFAPTAGGGTLVLGGTGVAAETLTLGGHFSGLRFVLAPEREYTQVSTIAQPITPAKTAPPGSAAPGQTFTWSAFNSGAGLWASPGNWAESGVGTASIALGANDTVWLTGAITGDGNAAQAFGVGPSVLAGNFAFGTLTVENALLGYSNATGPVDIGPGAVVAAATAEDADTLLVEGGGRLTVSGTLTVLGTFGDQGALAIYGGGAVAAADLELGSAVVAGTQDIGSAGAEIVLAADGTLEVGGDGLAQAGTVMVDGGATLGGSGTVDAPVFNAGTLVAAPNPGIAGALLLDRDVAGTGAVAIAAGGTLAVGGTIAATQSIAFTGVLGTVDLRPGGVVDGAVGGFAPGDAILAPAGVTGLSSVSGTLALLGPAGASVESIGLSGDFSGESFLLLPIAGAATAMVVLAPGTLLTGSPPPPPAGTAQGHSFVWTVQAGDWSDPANWTDQTSGATPATVAPGSLDSVTIPAQAAGLALLRGAGDVSLLSVAGTAALSGVFSAASVNVTGLYDSEGLLAVAAGSTLASSGTVQVSGVLAVSGAGAKLTAASLTETATNVFVPRDISVLDGGTLRAGALAMDDADGTIRVDPTGLLEVGAGGSPQRGAMVIDAGATASLGSGTVAATLVDNGVLGVAGTATLSGPVSGMGQLLVSTEATLTLGAGAGIAVMFAGTDATVQLDPASFTGVIGGFAWGDALDVTGVFDAAKLTAASAGMSRLTLWQGNQPVESLLLLGNYSGSVAQVAPATQVAPWPGPVTGTEVRLFVGDTPAPCFAAGTRIATIHGEAPVEALRAGDRVRLAGGGTAAIVWLGHRRVDCRRHPCPWDVHPVRVDQHAFGEGRPCRDLMLSPDHAVLINGVLIPIRYLINDATIVQEPVGAITYWHVELERHGVLLAEGLPAESYLDTGNRGAFENAGPVMALHPGFARGVGDPGLRPAGIGRPGVDQGPRDAVSPRAQAWACHDRRCRADGAHRRPAHRTAAYGGWGDGVRSSRRRAHPAVAIAPRRARACAGCRCRPSPPWRGGDLAEVGRGAGRADRRAAWRRLAGAGAWVPMD